MGRYAKRLTKPWPAGRLAVIQDSLADTVARRTAAQRAALYEGWGKPARAAEYRRRAEQGS